MWGKDLLSGRQRSSELVVVKVKQAEQGTRNNSRPDIFSACFTFFPS